MRQGDATAVGPLANALTDAPDVAVNAVTALGRIGGPAAVEALIGALKHTDGEVRETAAEALGKIGDPRALPALADTTDRHVGARIAAEGALAWIPDQPPVFSIEGLSALIARFDDDYLAVRARAASAAARLGKAAIGPLIAAYDTHKESVRRSVAQALAEIKDTSAVEPLIRIAQGDASPEVRREAASGLLGRNDARDQHPLAEAIIAGRA